MLSAGSSPNIADNGPSRSFPLHNAVEANCKACIKMLAMDGGANMRAKDSSGVSAMHKAVIAGKLNALDALIRCGSDPRE